MAESFSSALQIVGALSDKETLRRGRRPGAGRSHFAPNHFTCIVTENELFALLESVPLKVADPLVVIVPVTVVVKLIVTTIV